jgi:hypothetical protein
MLLSTYPFEATSPEAVGEGTIGESEKVFIHVIVSAMLPVHFTSPLTRLFQTVAVIVSPVFAFSTHCHQENQ